MKKHSVFENMFLDYTLDRKFWIQKAKSTFNFENYKLKNLNLNLKAL
jgi:hypothetical protein